MISFKLWSSWFTNRYTADVLGYCMTVEVMFHLGTTWLSFIKFYPCVTLWVINQEYHVIPKVWINHQHSFFFLYISRHKGKTTLWKIPWLKFKKNYCTSAAREAGSDANRLWWLSVMAVFQSEQITRLFVVIILL